MRKRLIIGGAIAAALVLLLGAAAFFYYLSTASDRDNASLLVYYYNPSANKLEPEMRTLPKGDNTVLVNAAFAWMRESPKNTMLIKTLPDNVELIGGVIKDGTVLEVSFSKTYLDMPPLEEALFRASFVYTMTELPFIQDVQILVDNEAMTNPHGNIMGLINRVNVGLNPVISPERKSVRSYKLYFVSENIEGLVAEERTSADANADQPEKYILQQLIAGPGDASHISGIPAETKIRKITTEDGICHVNLSSDFVNKFNGSPALAKLTIYAIVNSLTENITNVKKVQFLIESERVDQFKGVTDFNLLFERDESLIIAEEETTS